jgi:hypothetical protein
MKAKGFGGVEILPVRHKDDSQWENFGLHDPNLGPQQRFLLWRRSDY